MGLARRSRGCERKVDRIHRGSMRQHRIVRMLCDLISTTFTDQRSRSVPEQQGESSGQGLPGPHFGILLFGIWAYTEDARSAAVAAAKIRVIVEE